MTRKKIHIFKYIKEGIFFKKLKNRLKYKYLIKYGYRLDDKDYLLKMGRLRLGYDMNLDNPQTFQEKLNCLKLNDHKDIYTMMADKYLMKKFVSEKIGGGAKSYSLYCYTKSRHSKWGTIQSFLNPSI